jgi:hypothetical protein
MLTMIIQKVISDHINNWSDIDEKQINRISSQKAKDSYKQTPASRYHTSWFYNQTLQTLWKTRMQVCWRPWAWSQVLPFGQPTWKHSANGLYSTEIPGTSRRICREFSQDKTAFGGNKLDQPRTSSPSRAAIGVLHGTSGSQHDCSLLCRHCRNRSSCCQYARSNSASRTRRISFKGGSDR